MPDFSLEISAFGIPTAFLWIAFIVELTPGPNHIAALTLAEGRRAGFVTVAGIAMGLLVSLLAAFGVATFVSESTALFAALKWAGVFYMLWLAYDIWRAKDQAEAQLAAESPMTTYVARGFLTNVLNPKAAVFFIAVLPQFIGPNTRFDRRFGYRWLKPS